MTTIRKQRQTARTQQFGRNWQRSREKSSLATITESSFTLRNSVNATWPAYADKKKSLCEVHCPTRDVEQCRTAGEFCILTETSILELPPPRLPRSPREEGGNLAEVRDPPAGCSTIRAFGVPQKPAEEPRHVYAACFILISPFVNRE